MVCGRWLLFIKIERYEMIYIKYLRVIKSLFVVVVNVVFSVCVGGGGVREEWFYFLEGLLVLSVWLLLFVSGN